MGHRITINESQFHLFINEINDIYSGLNSDSKCPYLNKVFGNGFTLRKMLRYDDFTDRIDYASKHLKILGRGKRRTAFILNDSMILKLSNGSHTFQTQNEYNFALTQNIDIMPRIIYQSSDFSWTIMEKAEPLSDSMCREILGMPLYAEDYDTPSLEGFQLWAETVAREKSRQQPSKLRMQPNKEVETMYRNLVNTNDWFRKLYKLEFSQRGDLNFGTDINPSGFDFRGENLGVVNRDGRKEIVLLDGGFLAPWGDVRKLPSKAEKVRNRMR